MFMLDVGYLSEQLDGLLGGFCWGLTGQELTCQAKNFTKMYCMFRLKDPQIHFLKDTHFMPLFNFKQINPPGHLK